MKKTILLSAGMILCLLLAACSKDETTTNSTNVENQPTTKTTTQKEKTTEKETVAEEPVKLTNVTTDEVKFMLQTNEKTQYDLFDKQLVVQVDPATDGYDIGKYKIEDGVEVAIGDTSTHINSTLTEVSIPLITGKTSWKASLEPAVILAYRKIQPTIKEGNILTYYNKQDQYIVLKEVQSNSTFVAYHIYNRNTDGVVVTKEKEDPFLYL